MLLLHPNWGFLHWHRWLEQQGLAVGRDYRWSWNADRACWAAEFAQPEMELFVKLRLPNEYHNKL